MGWLDGIGRAFGGLTGGGVATVQPPAWPGTAPGGSTSGSTSATVGPVLAYPALGSEWVFDSDNEQSRIDLDVSDAWLLQVPYSRPVTGLEAEAARQTLMDQYGSVASITTDANGNVLTIQFLKLPGWVRGAVGGILVLAIMEALAAIAAAFAGGGLSGAFKLFRKQGQTVAAVGQAVQQGSEAAAQAAQQLANAATSLNDAVSNANGLGPVLLIGGGALALLYLLGKD